MAKQHYTIESFRDTPAGRLPSNAHVFGEKHSKEKKRSKYGNTKTRVGGIEFDSEKEAKRYSELRILLKKGIIGMMARQVEYALHVNNEPVASYVADFQYIESETGKVIVEDVKSEATRKLPVYRLKKKLMKSIHGIVIKEY